MKSPKMHPVHPAYQCKASGQKYHDLCCNTDDGSVECCNAGCKELWVSYNHREQEFKKDILFEMQRIVETIQGESFQFKGWRYYIEDLRKKYL